MDQFQHVGQQHAQIGAALMGAIGNRQGVGGLAGQHGFQRIEHRFPVG